MNLSCFVHVAIDQTCPYHISKTIIVGLANSHEDFGEYDEDCLRDVLRG